MKCLAWLISVAKGSKALEGEKHKEQKQRILELRTCYDWSIVTERIVLTKRKAACRRNSPYKIIFTEGDRSFCPRDFLQ